MEIKLNSGLRADLWYLAALIFMATNHMVEVIGSVSMDGGGVYYYLSR